MYRISYKIFLSISKIFCFFVSAFSSFVCIWGFSEAFAKNDLEIFIFSIWFLVIGGFSFSALYFAEKESINIITEEKQEN